MTLSRPQTSILHVAKAKLQAVASGSALTKLWRGLPDDAFTGHL